MLLDTNWDDIFAELKEISGWSPKITTYVEI